MRWIEDIDGVTAEVEERFGDLASDPLDWKPSPDRWSIAENLEHLVILNESYFPVLDAMREGRYEPPFHARFGFVTRFFGNFIRNAVSPDRSKKMKTFGLWEPTRSEIGQGIVQRFRRHQERLKDEIRASAELVEKGAVLASPASKVIVYPVETAFDIIVDHERRHLNQAREVLALLREEEP